ELVPVFLSPDPLESFLSLDQPSSSDESSLEVTLARLLAQDDRAGIGIRGVFRIWRLLLIAERAAALTASGSEALKALGRSIDDLVRLIVPRGVGSEQPPVRAAPLAQSG